MTEALSEPEVYATLTRLAATVAPGNHIVELGTYRGASAVALAEGSAAGHNAPITTIDPHDLPGERTTTGRGKVHHRIDYTDPANREAAATTIAHHPNGDLVTMVRDFSTHAAETWPHGRTVELLLIDGDHRAPAVRHDYSAWEKHLTNTAVIVFDDYRADRFPGVVATVHHLEAKGLITPYILGTLAICNRKRR